MMQEFENNHLEDTNETPQEAKVEEQEVQQVSQEEQKDTHDATESIEMKDQHLEDEEALIQSKQMSEDAKQEQKEQPKTKKKQKKVHGSFIKQHKTGVTITSCFLLAGIGGFGGTLAANQFSGNGKVVMYQSVNKNSSNSDNNSANTSTMSVKDIANQTMDSVVEIKTESVQTNQFFQQAVTSGAGSGVILSSDGYIVTNNHVIEGATKVSVTTKDGEVYNATLVGSDATTDLAVIKIEPKKDLTPVVMGSSDSLEVGDPAIAIGNPLGELGGTVTNGIISALDRAITIDGETMHLLQTNAAINPGNSGGGLFNEKGELIGIVNAKSSGSNIEGLGFAIPIDKAKPVIESLIENGKVTGRAELGVSLSEVSNQSNNPFAQQTDDTKSVYIAKVQSGKAADNAGLQVGDRIVQADGKDIDSIATLKSIITSHKAGDTMTMKIERDGKEKEVKITLLEVTTEATEKTSFQGGNAS